MAVFTALQLQDPGETLLYEVDWTSSLDPNETIASSTWATDAAGPALSAPQVNAAATCATVLLGSVAFAGVYRLVNQVYTTAGRSLTASIIVRAAPR